MSRAVALGAPSQGSVPHAASPVWIRASGAGPSAPATLIGGEQRQPSASVMSGWSPALPLTDADRERCLELLRAHCVDGRLTLAEYAQRAELVLSAGSPVELGALTRDLPPPQPFLPAERRTAWAINIFGSSRHQVRRRLSKRTFVMSVFGSAWLDLGDALIDAEEVSLTAVAIFGTVKVVVPSGIEVDMASLPVFGASKDESGRGRPVVGSPVVRVRSLPIFGTVKVIESTRVTDQD